MKRKIHVVPHTHWDREWYFTTSRSSVYLMNNVKDILNTLESDHKFTYFMLDAQGSLLDDYCKWMPQDKGRIKALVKAKRLIIGPWYTQSDQMVISAESIVRNLFYGIQTCEEFGSYMNVGYVPDSFGQAGNMPQIYREFGIEDTLFWRGVSNDMASHTDYIWRGDDGSEVFATQIPLGYYIGGNIPEDEEESKIFWEDVCLKKAGSGATKNIYFPQGFDQCPIRHNLAEIIEKRNQEDSENEYVISCIEDYIKDVKQENPTLEVVEGELLNAKHMRIHRSIFSSRSDLKQMNTKIQNYVTNTMEPILALASYLGYDYPKEAVKEVWKLLFENAAHDSIGSCISDSANEDVYMRYKKARDIAENLVELYERYIVTGIKSDKEGVMTFTLFQTLPYEREEVIIKQLYIPNIDFILEDDKGNTIPYTILEKEDISDYVLSQTIRLNPSKPQYVPNKVNNVKIAIQVKHIPSFGYVQLSLKECKATYDPMETMDFIENAIYKIQVEENGLLCILDKRNGYVYHDQCEYLENGDDGDSFNYSPPRKDMAISSRNTLVSSEAKGCSFYQTLSLTHQLCVPFDLEQRANQHCSNSLPMKTTIELKENDPMIYFHTQVDNHVLSHRLCVVFDADIATSCNYADQQFGIIKRDNEHSEDMRLYNEALQQNKKESVSGPLNWANAQHTWQEPSVPIEPTQSFVSLCDDERGIALIPAGVREYEIIGERKNKICLTLFRTYGTMGKENLLYRPGRASGEKIIETPDAQLLKPLELSFGFMSYTASFNERDVAQQAKRYHTSVDVYSYADFLNGRLIFVQEDCKQTHNKQKNIWKLEQNHLLMSACKPSEDGKGYILRFYNPYYKKSIGDTIVFNTTLKQAYYVDLLERKKDTILRFDHNRIYIEDVKHCKFVSIYVEV